MHTQISSCIWNRTDQKNATKCSKSKKMCLRGSTEYRFGNQHFFIFWLIPLHLIADVVFVRIAVIPINEWEKISHRDAKYFWKWVTFVLRGLFLEQCTIIAFCGGYVYCAHARLWKETFSDMFVHFEEFENWP